MPGWILVAKRFSFLSTVGNNGGILSVFASLACLVVLSGCSNIQQQPLELPLPILPSLTAAPASGNNAALVDSAVDGAVADGSVESNFADSGSPDNPSEFDKEAVSNDFAASDFVQRSSAQSFLPAENEFQPPTLQPQARFVGVLGKADMEEIKLTATPSNSEPAPAITSAVRQDGLAIANGSEARKASETCETNGSASCACCKKKQPPKLADVEPFDLEPSLGLLAPIQTTPKTNAVVTPRGMLQPLASVRATDIEPTTNSDTAKIPATSTDVGSPPIRLTAMSDSELAEVRQPSLSAIAAPEQTPNKAQLLLPIAPNSLRGFNAEPKQTDDILESKQVIKVSPTLNLNSAVVEVSPAVSPDPSVTNDYVGPMVTTQADLLPVSTSEIRVSAATFKSFGTPIISTPDPVVEPSEPTVQEIAKPTPVDQPFQVAEVTESDEPKKTVEPVEKDELVDFATDELEPKELEPSESSFADIDPVADLEGLPDMKQIEKELDEFKKFNTFDPSSVIKTDRIDPAWLLAKLDGPPKKIVPPKPEVTEAAPDNDLIAQQLDAHNSALRELKDAIKELKPEPVTVNHEAPKLTLSNAAFCTKISGFGQFKPFAANNFSSSQKTLLYCEVDNQTSKQFTGLDGTPQFETVLHGSIVIYDANDQVVQTARFPAIKDVARQRRRDFYVYFPVQFNDLANGDYRLELSVEDVAGNQTAVLQSFMRFSVR